MRTGQPAARARTRRRRLRRRCSPGFAAQATGPLLRPQGCCASRCAQQPCGLPLTPETSAPRGSRKSRQARACPRCAAAHEPAARVAKNELTFDSQKEAENYTNPL
jgi:hypothetical protein